MEEIKIVKTILSCSIDELDEADRALVEAARKATDTSYSPYSRFRVGAAVRLAGGTVVTGSNQENAAYPSGLCAERVALFAAGAGYPDRAVEALAIAAADEVGFTSVPVTPCGACRQVLLECEARGGKPVRVIMAGAEKALVADGAETLLPLAFGDSYLKQGV